MTCSIGPGVGLGGGVSLGGSDVGVGSTKGEEGVGNIVAGVGVRVTLGNGEGEAVNVTGINVGVACGN
jgi:hypothetical protein